MTANATQTFRTEHGIWSDAAGGFIDSNIYSQAEADGLVSAFIAAGEDADDLQVLAFCTDHRDDEQPERGCEMCDDEGDEDDEDDEDDDQ